MKISRSDSNSASGLGRSSGVGFLGAAPAPKRPAVQKASDQAQVSNLSRYLASALDGSPAHLSKMGELGAAVSNGRYRVDAYAVSGSIIQHGIEFGGARYSAMTT
jgi:anti-sigma28 factor (negative regulator of flagellin synthesis)